MTRRTLGGVCVTAALLAGAALRGEAADVVEILLRGHYFMAPATVQFTVAVEPDAANRLLRIEADGDELFRASELTLNGAREKRLHNFEFRNLPAGAYALRAAVLDSNYHVRGMDSHKLIVTGSGQR
ncbi:MAG: hypothetical protein HYY76_05865 [Acidobacteria bacterium]|nr:hypothetical protein [Acidobacteriota bacterium]